MKFRRLAVSRVVRAALIRAALCGVASFAVIGCTAHEGETSKSAETSSAKAVLAKQDAAAADFTSPARRRLMTGQQYLNTIADMFGSDIQVLSPFSPLQRTDGLLASGAASVAVPAGELQQFQRAAATVATQVVSDNNVREGVTSHRDRLIPCRPAAADQADDACAAKFLKQTARLLYRRPVSDAKLALLVKEANSSAGTLKDFCAGLASVLEGMLISPDVLYVYDRTEPDPAHPGRLRLDAYSYASRLSFFLWDAAPDSWLLDAAAGGQLDSDKGRKQVVEKMLASPRLEAGVRAFFDDMFGFDGFDNLAKDPAAYPLEIGQTLADAREQTLRTVYDQLIVKNKDYRDLYTTRDTFMSPALAVVYRVPTTPGWVPYEFPEGSPRTGLLTQVSFLALHAHPGRSSATRRGKALREILLCQHVPLPPPNVDFSAVENPDPTLHTARDRLTMHRKNPVCAGCHRITDPMGLALENFDGSGQYRATEKGSPIDTSGSLDGKDFTNVQGLAQALHDHPGLPTCLVRRVYSYGIGGPLVDADNAVLGYLDQRFVAAGYRFTDLLRTIALSPSFRDIAPPHSETPAVKTAEAAPAASAK